MELSATLILVITFVIIILLAVGILLFLDWRNPKRKKSTFLSGPQTLYLFGYPIKAWYLAITTTALFGIIWIMELPSYISFIYLVLILLFVKQNK